MKTIENFKENELNHFELEWTVNIPSSEKALELANKILNQKYELNDYISLIMYESIVCKRWWEIDKQVSDAIDKFADKYKLVPALTYESLIMFNPLDDKPLLFSEVYSEDELLFYKTHLEIEKSLYAAISNVFYVYGNLSKDDIYEKLYELEEKLVEVEQTMKNLMRDFSKEWFQNIRWYFWESHRKDASWKNYNWPSWAYTATYPFLDIVFWVKNIWDAYSLNDELLPRLSWRGYTTIDDIKKIEIIVAQRWTIDKLFEKWSLEYKKISSILNHILSFRWQHRWVANKYIWKENLENSWTWWSHNAWKFLDQHIDDTKKVITDIIS